MKAIIPLYMMCAVSNAFAQDTWLAGEGALLCPTQASAESSAIHVVDAQILIEGQKHKNALVGFNVTSRLSLKNTTEKSMDLHLAMPFVSYSVEEREAFMFATPNGKEPNENMIYNAQFLVRGVPVDVTEVDFSKVDGKAAFNKNYNHAWSFDVQIAANETIEIQNSFQTGITTDIWGRNFAHYAIKTAKTWHEGTIDHLQIEFRPNERFQLCSFESENAINPAPSIKNWKIEGVDNEKRIVWDLNAVFAAQDDLSVCFYTPSSYVDKLLNDCMQTCESLSEQERVICANLPAASHGKTFKDELKTHFEAQWWYSPHFAYSSGALSEFEKSVIASCGGSEESTSSKKVNAKNLKKKGKRLTK